MWFRTSPLGGVDDARSTDHVVTLARISARRCFCSAFMVTWYPDFCFLSIWFGLVWFGLVWFGWFGFKFLPGLWPCPLWRAQPVSSRKPGLPPNTGLAVTWLWPVPADRSPDSRGAAGVALPVVRATDARARRASPFIPVRDGRARFEWRVVSRSFWSGGAKRYRIGWRI